MRPSIYSRAARRYSTSTTKPPVPPPPLPPPPPGVYQPVAPAQKSQQQEQLSTTRTGPRPKQPTSLLARLLPSPQPSPFDIGTRDAARGIEATQRVVREGVLDPRYRPAARSVTALICALPVAIYLSYELYQRRFMGKEQKRRIDVTTGKLVGAGAGGDAS